MKTKTTLYLLVLFVLILTACASISPTQAPGATTAPPARDLLSVPAAEPSTASEGFSSKAGVANAPVQQPAVVNRLVIKNADLVIVVADPSAGMTAILDMANEMGGYVVSSKSFKIRSENGVEVPQ